MKITAVITTRNRFEMLKKAVKSVENQTRLPDELIIIDDNSNDKTQKYFTGRLSLKFPLIYFHNDKNMGAPFCRNQAIERASGDYIAFLDDDDEWEKDKLLKQIKFAEKKFDLIYTAVKIFSEKDGVYDISDKIYFHKSSPFPPKIAICLGNFVGITSTIMLNLKFLRKIGGFNSKLPALQDYELVIRAINNNAKVKGIEIPLVKYGKSSKNLQNISALPKNFFAASSIILSKTSLIYKPLQLLGLLRIFAQKFIKSQEFRSQLTHFYKAQIIFSRQKYTRSNNAC